MKNDMQSGCGAVAGIMLFALTEAKAFANPEFIISYWGGPPLEETSVERYREIADCGFNLAMPSADNASFVADLKTDPKANLKILHVCKTVGLKAIVKDDRLQLT